MRDIEETVLLGYDASDDPYAEEEQAQFQRLALPAIQAARDRGDPLPVLFNIVVRGPGAYWPAEKLLSRLAGEAEVPHVNRDHRSFVVTRERAREILSPFVPRSLLLFPVPSCPTSFYTLIFREDYIRAYESLLCEGVQSWFLDRGGWRALPEPGAGDDGPNAETQPGVYLCEDPGRPGEVLLLDNRPHGGDVARREREVEEIRQRLRAAGLEEFEELPSPDTDQPGGYIYGLHLSLNGKDVKLVQDIVAAVVAGGPAAGGDGVGR
jgi:hypothetical protein